MKKTDAIIGAIIGFLIGIFFFILLSSVLKEMEVKIPHLWTLPLIFSPLALLGIYIISLIGKKLLFVYQMGKFALVGALNTFIDLGILNILMWTSGIAIGPWYSFFKTISFLMATTNSYFWNKHWTFGKREKVFATKEFSKFFIVTTIGLAINVGIASFVVNVIGNQYGISEFLWGIIGGFIAVLFAWIWNFLGAKFIVFRK